MRAPEDARRTDLIHQAWADSGKVYGYRSTDWLQTSQLLHHVLGVLSLASHLVILLKNGIILPQKLDHFSGDIPLLSQFVVIIN